MNLDWGTVLQVGSMAFMLISALLADKWQGKQHSKDIDLLWAKTREIEAWEQNYEREAAERRLELVVKVSEAQGSTQNLAKTLESIEKKVDSLSIKVDRISENRN